MYSGVENAHTYREGGEAIIRRAYLYELTA